MSEPTIASFCTGYGGLDDAVRRVFGGRLVSWSDVAAGPIKVMQRHAPGIPNLGSVKDINWFRQSLVDIFTAGYPCQPFSNAGLRLGTDDPRHLWPWIIQGIGILRPRVVVLENVAAHLRRGFDVVSADLARVGYRVAWGITRAADVGAPHPRRRLFIVAVAEDPQRQPGNEWWLPASRQAEGGWAWPDAGRRDGVAAAVSEGERRAPRGDGPARAQKEFAEPVVSGYVAANPYRTGLEEWHGLDSHEFPTVERSGNQTVSDARGVGWEERRPESAGPLGGFDVAQCGIPDPSRWGVFAEAVARWESVRGLRAPDATVTGARGGQVLAPRFVEWMMGLEPGHVTDTPGLSRPAQLELLGNGVVPQQAEAAIRHLAGVLARY